jgi:hypothetical protein
MYQVEAAFCVAPFPSTLHAPCSALLLLPVQSVSDCSSPEHKKKSSCCQPYTFMPNRKHCVGLLLLLLFCVPRYRASEGIQVPFKVIPVVKELGRTRLEANVSVRSLFGAKMFALNTVVLVPVPDYTAKTNIVVTTGKAKYDATKKAIVSDE